MPKKNDLAFLKKLCQVYQTTTKWQYQWVDWKSIRSHLDLSLGVHGRKSWSASIPISLILLWQINSCSLICNYPLEESLDLERGIENSVLNLEHGQCGPTVELKSTTMELEVSKHMAFIHLPWSKHKIRQNGLVSSLEMPTPRVL